MSRKTQWLVFVRGEVYAKFLDKYEAVFLFKESDGWCAWYGRWNPKYFGEKPVREVEEVG